MFYQCKCCQRVLNPNQPYCGNCGAKVDNSLPPNFGAPATPRRKTPPEILNLVKVLSVCIVIVIILGIGLFVRAAWRAITPTGEATIAAQEQKIADQKEKAATQAALIKAKQATEAKHQANLAAQEAKRQSQREARQRHDKTGQQAQTQTVQTDTTSTPPGNPSPEFMLATLQSDGPVDQNDLLVRQFAAQLDALESKFTDPLGKHHKRRSIVNMTVQVHDDLEAKGVDDSYLEILTNVNASIPANVSVGTHIEDMFAAYYEMRIPH